PDSVRAGARAATGRLDPWRDLAGRRSRAGSAGAHPARPARFRHQHRFCDRRGRPVMARNPRIRGGARLGVVAIALVAQVLSPLASTTLAQTAGTPPLPSPTPAATATPFATSASTGSVC